MDALSVERVRSITGIPDVGLPVVPNRRRRRPFPSMAMSDGSTCGAAIAPGHHVRPDTVLILADTSPK